MMSSLDALVKGGEPEDMKITEKTCEDIKKRKLLLKKVIYPYDYHYLYVKTDIVLLADVFKNFRKVCMGRYRLDPAHYYKAPGLSWDALLKKTGIELELLTDLYMHLFIEKGMQGGISMASKQYTKANNLRAADYDPAKPSKFITYLDANNLYSWVMSLPLPSGRE